MGRGVDVKTERDAVEQGCSYRHGCIEGLGCRSRSTGLVRGPTPSHRPYYYIHGHACSERRGLAWDIGRGGRYGHGMR